MISGCTAFRKSFLGPIKSVHIYLRFTATTQSSSDASQEPSSAKPLEDIPGPPWLKNIKNNILDPNIAKQQHIAWKEMEQEFGEIIKIWIPIVGNIIFIKNPEDIQKLLTKDGKFPIEPAFDAFITYRNVMRKQLFPQTAGLLGHHGEKWWEFRSKVQQDMMRPKSAMFYLQDLEEISAELVDLLSSRRDDNYEVEDVLPYLHRWGLESISAIFLDARLGCLDETQPPDSDGRRMIAASQVLTGPDALKLMQIPLWRYIPLPFYRRYDKAATTMYNISEKHIKVAMERVNKAEEEGGEDEGEKSVLSKLMKRCGPESQIPLVMAMDALFAGIDTTGNTGTMFLYHLAINPDKQETLYQDIVSLIGQDGNLSESNLNKMKYLKASLRESMRMFSAAWGFHRRTQVDMVLSGYLIPADTWVFHVFNNTSMDENQFPDPDQFRPERWLRGCDQVEQKKAHPFASIPFAHGPRMCVGRRFAELEMVVMLVKVLQRFRIEYRHQPIGKETNMTMTPDKPVKLKLIERE